MCKAVLDSKFSADTQVMTKVPSSGATVEIFALTVMNKRKTYIDNLIVFNWKFCAHFNVLMGFIGLPVRGIRNQWD